jgi:heme A synthase
MGSIYVLWVFWNLWGKQNRSAWMLILSLTLMAQIALGAINVVLLAPV